MRFELCKKKQNVKIGKIMNEEETEEFIPRVL